MNQDRKYHTVNMRKYFLKRTTINNDTLDNWTPRDHPIGYRSEEPDASNNVLYTLRVIVNPLIMHNERQLSGVVWCGVVWCRHFVSTQEGRNIYFTSVEDAISLTESEGKKEQRKTYLKIEDKKFNHKIMTNVLVRVSQRCRNGPCFVEQSHLYYLTWRESAHRGFSDSDCDTFPRWMWSVSFG